MAPRRRRRRGAAAAVCLPLLGAAAASVTEPCWDDDATMHAQSGVDCAGAVRLQLCRNTVEQQSCVDNDESLRQYTPSRNCSHAVMLTGCTDMPEVSRWCPRTCGTCPLTPWRSEAVHDARRLCPVLCGLCPGQNRHDCFGEFGPWSRCHDCRRVRRYRVLQAAVEDGAACPHLQDEEEVSDCCGVGTRWRVVAAAPLKSFWEVERVEFFASGGCASGAPPHVVRVAPEAGVRPGVNGTLWAQGPEHDSDPAQVERTTCLDCCTVDKVGPIASGSAPAPYGCESALLRDARPGAAWRSSCEPCQAGEAWLGFRTSGRSLDVTCAEVSQRAYGASSSANHVPALVRLERWNGSDWEALAEASGEALDGEDFVGGGHVRLEVRKTSLQSETPLMAELRGLLRPPKAPPDLQLALVLALIAGGITLLVMVLPMFVRQGPKGPRDALVGGDGDVAEDKDVEDDEYGGAGYVQEQEDSETQPLL